MALQDMAAAMVANAIIEEWIMKVVAPEVIHTEEGLIFSSELKHGVCRFLWSRKRELRCIILKEMGRMSGSIESVPIRFRNLALKNHRNGMCVCRTLLLCITPLSNRTIGATPYSIIFGREA